MATASSFATFWLASLFLYSALVKIADFKRSVGLLEQTIRQLGPPVPERGARVSAFALPWIEMFVGCGLIVGVARPAGAAAILLGLAFAGASVSVLGRAADVPCGCAGPSGADRLDRTSLIRGLIIAACGVVLFVDGQSPAPLTVRASSLGVAFVLALLFVLGQRRKNAPRRDQSIARADVERAVRVLAQSAP
jgi:uncharacterized membrane protein YphA (DoxX/SURF4 family)